jgi:hypothetical protein
MPFLNHLAVLSLLPALMLFFSRSQLLALTLSLAFLAGYPPFLLGGALLAWALAAALAGSNFQFGRRLAGWAGAGVLAAGLAACQLLPGLELLTLSRRGAGMGLEETLLYGYAPRDLLLWISPLMGGGNFNAAVNWTRCSHIGWVATCAAILAFFHLGWRRRAGLCFLLGSVFILILGAATPVSRAVWAHFPALRFVRYPGNLAFLGWPLTALLAAAGVARLAAPWRAAALPLIAAELLIYAAGAQPAAPREVFTDAGPLVRRLQEQVPGSRYLISPLALESHSGFGVADWKRRLYGLTNDPYRLRAAGNFGEPLVPKPSYDFMDFLYAQPSAVAAARFLPAVGTPLLITRDELKPAPQLIKAFDAKEFLWQGYRVAGSAALAWLLDKQAGAALGGGLPNTGLPAGALPLSLNWSGEDRFSVAIDQPAGPGWAFIAEPRFPGWRAILIAGGRQIAIQTLPAWHAFQKIQVPTGPWRLEFRYEPLSWRLGLTLSLLCLLGLGAYWYNFGLRAFDAS